MRSFHKQEWGPACPIELHKTINTAQSVRSSLPPRQHSIVLDFPLMSSLLRKFSNLSTKSKSSSTSSNNNNTTTTQKMPARIAIVVFSMYGVCIGIGSNCAQHVAHIADTIELRF